MRFLCDHMLGSLARWLRFLGYDTVYPEPQRDADLLDLAEREGRILVTRDRDLARRAPNAFLVESVDLEEQLRAVTAAFDLDARASLTRCSVCNGVLKPVPHSEVADRVPPGIRERQTEFWRCAGCGRIYWPGSHHVRLVERINAVAGE